LKKIYSAKPIRFNTPRLASAVKRHCFWLYRDRKSSNFCGRPEGACRRARNTAPLAARIGCAEQKFYLI